MFHDRARLTAVAGRGGDGSIHFRREKYVPRGGPDGGDGGDGGDVVLVADLRRRDLSGVRPNQKLRAGRGGAGGGRGSNGARGDDAVLPVPVGTQVFEGEELVADLAQAGARVVVAKGGTGGRGNKHFAGPSRQTPRFAEVGLPGEEREIELRLKLLADAALVGLPNAGKSSLLTRISNARPKVAEYPFTTLSPVLGTVEASDGRQLVVADVPGLIEGASEGVGLGHEFLAHLERARVLVHVIDSSEDDADERWRTIDAELAAYGAGLDERPQIVVLNKIDLRPEPPAFGIEDERIVRVLRVSAATGAGPRRAAPRAVRARPARRRSEEQAETADEIVDFLVYQPQPARRAFRVYRTERGFRVTGKPPAEEELEAILKRGRRPRRATRSRSGRSCSSGSDGPLRRRVRPAASRSRRRRRRREGALRRRAARRPRRTSVRGIAAVHASVRGPARARAPRRSPTTTCGSIPYPRTVELLRAERFDDPVFVIGADQFASLSRLERARRGARAGPPRGGDAARLPAQRARRRARAARPARARPLLRDRAESGRLHATSGPASPPESRSTGSFRPPWRGSIAERGLYRP